MGDRNAAGFFTVVSEVRLDLLIRVVAYDLYGVLVRADGTVRADAPEFAGDRSGGNGVGIFFSR